LLISDEVREQIKRIQTYNGEANTDDISFASESVEIYSDHKANSSTYVCFAFLFTFFSSLLIKRNFEQNKYTQKGICSYAPPVAR
jgi:hypothetical protein